MLYIPYVDYNPCVTKNIFQTFDTGCTECYSKQSRACNITARFTEY